MLKNGLLWIQKTRSIDGTSLAELWYRFFYFPPKEGP